MPESTVGVAPTSAAVDPGDSLGAELSAFMGDFGSSDVPPADSAGAGDSPSPQRPGESAEPVGAAPEGEPALERTDSPSVDAAPQTPDSAPVPDAGDDLLARATPFDYVVSGQAKTFDGIQLLPDNAGAIISADRLPQVRSIFSERDHLYEKDRAQRDQIAVLERASEWTTTNADGTKSTLTGRDAIEAAHVLLARSMAAYNTLRLALETPEQLAALLEVNEAGQVLASPQALRHLANEGKLAARDAEDRVRHRFSSIAQTASRSAEDATLPAQLWQAAETHWLSKHASLTAEDKSFLESQVGRYIRPATAQELAQGLTRQVIDGSFYAVIEKLASQRDTTVQQATAASRSNAAKLAAVAAGQRPATAKPAAPAPTRQPDERATRSEQAWNNLEAAVRPRRAG